MAGIVGGFDIRFLLESPHERAAPLDAPADSKRRAIIMGCQRPFKSTLRGRAE
jgi:hypothetical protein